MTRTHEQRISFLEVQSIIQWMVIVFLAIGFGWCVRNASGAEQSMLPSDAAAVALADVQTLDGNTAQFIRYLWCEEANPLYHSSLYVALNMLGHDINYFRPGVLPHGYLLRVDLRQMAGSGLRSAEEFAAVRDAWESIFDPSFHIAEQVVVNISVITVDTVVRQGSRTVVEVSAGTQVEVVTRQKNDRGKDYVYVRLNGKEGYVKEDEIETQEKIEQQRFGLGSFAEALDQLATATGSRAPIVHAPHFLAVAMVAADPGIGHAPLYYRFLDWEGLSLEQLFDRYKLRIEDVLDYESAAYAVVNLSQVLDKTRAVTVAVVPTIRPTVALPYWYLSLDFADASDATNDPFLNLLNPRPEATEIVATRPNGLFAYAVANIEYDDEELSFLDALRAGKVTADLVGEADSQVASDRQLPPNPAPCRLIVGLSCANCHGEPGADGLQPVPNDMLTINEYRAKSGLKPIVTGDVSGQQAPDDVLKRIAGRYYLDLEPTLALARLKHSEIVARITSQPGKPDGFEPNQVYAEMARVYRDYVYNKVGREQALRECAGVVLEEGDDAAQWIEAMLPPLPPNRFGISPEHPNIVRLKAGLPLPRKAFNLIKRDLLLRMAPQVAEFRKLKAMPPIPNQENGDDDENRKP